MSVSLRVGAFGVCLLLAACGKKESAATAAATPAPVAPAKPRFDPAVVQRGEALHAKLRERTIDAKLNVWGAGFPTAKACLWVPEEDWKAFSPEDREALITYVKAQIPMIRQNADRYAGIPSTAPLFPRLRSNVANMQDDAFVIFALVQDGGQWLGGPLLAGTK